MKGKFLIVCTFPSPLSHVRGDRQTEGEKHQYNQAAASIIQMALNWKPDNFFIPNVTILIEWPSMYHLHKILFMPRIEQDDISTVTLNFPVNGL